MIVVVDTETTGLDKQEDEILQLSVIDINGAEVYNNYYKPSRHTEWKEAEAVNGITPEMVADACSIDSELEKLNELFAKVTTYIGYNSYFDIDFLKAAGVKFPDNMEVVDVMADFAPIYGEWSDKYGCFKWQKLTVCASFYGYDWGISTAHDSLSDCLATLHCYKTMKKSNAKEN